MITIQVKFYNQEKKTDAYDILESRFILWPHSKIKYYSNFLKIEVQTEIELNVVLGFLNAYLTYIESCKWERSPIDNQPLGTPLSRAMSKEGR